MAVEIGASHQNGGPNEVANPVSAAIRRASQATGVGFDYLINTAMRESSLNTEAQAKTSSAAGLFQFVEQTWLGAVKIYGARHGLSNEAAAITHDPAGVFRVADSAAREDILNLRFDANASAALAGELAGENKQLLERHLGRAANAADLYAAHFLGPSGAVKLLSAAGDLKAADILPAAANSNRYVFYEGTREKTVGEVIASIGKSMGLELGEIATASTSMGGASGSITNIVTADGKVERENVSAKQNFGYGDVLPAQREARRSPVPFFGGKLSMIAISILQALDPTRLSADRSEQNRDRNAFEN